MCKKENTLFQTSQKNGIVGGKTLSDLLVDGLLAWAWQCLFLIFSQLQISIWFHLPWRTSQDTLMEFLLTSGLYCLSMLTINHCWPLAVWCWWRCWCRRWCWNWVNANVAVDADMHGNVRVEVDVVYLLLLTINYHWLLTIVDFQHARQYRQQDHYQGLPKPPWILIMGIVPRRILNIFALDIFRKEQRVLYGIICKLLFFSKSKLFVAKFVDDIFAKSKLHTDRKAHKGNQWTNTALDWKTFKTISIKAQFLTTSAGNYCFPKLKWTMRPPQFESLHHMCFQSKQTSVSCRKSEIQVLNFHV